MTAHDDTTELTENLESQKHRTMTAHDVTNELTETQAPSSDT